MKKVALLTCLLALAISAGAQTLNLASLPATLTPTQVPNGFGGFQWTGADYVSPAWSGANRGFRLGPDADDVIFGGGPICRTEPIACEMSISSNFEFKAMSAQLASAQTSASTSQIVVTAYLNGTFVGSQQYTLSSASMSKIVFPASWGLVTELVIHPKAGSEFVLYGLHTAGPIV